MPVAARVLFLFAFVLTVFGKLPPSLRYRQETFLNYGGPLAAFVIALSVLGTSPNHRRTGLTELYRPTLIFFAYYFIIWIVKAFMSDLQPLFVIASLRTELAGPLMGCALIYIISRTLGTEDRMPFAKQVLASAILIFALQLAISIVESRRGESFVPYGELGMGGLEGRDLLELYGGSLVDRFGFHLPFYGMLGQHNYFGNMLISYNALWVGAYLLTRQARYLVLIATTLFAVIGNSTRTAIAAVLLVDLLFFVQVVGGSHVASRFAKVTAAIFVIFGLALSLREGVGDYLAESNTFAGRIDLWTCMFDDLRYGLFSKLEMVFGGQIENLSRIGFTYRGREEGSFENQYLAVFFTAGGVGLILFLWATLTTFARLRQSFQSGFRLVISGIAVAYLIGFVTLDLHFHFASIVAFVAALFVLKLAAERHQHTSLARATTTENASLPLSMPVPQTLPG